MKNRCILILFGKILIFKITSFKKLYRIAFKLLTDSGI